MSALTFKRWAAKTGYRMNTSQYIAAEDGWDAREPELQELRAEVERLRTNQIGWNDLEVTYVSAIHNLEDQLAAAEAEVERLREQLDTLKAAWEQQQALHEAIGAYDDRLQARLAAAERVMEVTQTLAYNSYAPSGFVGAAAQVEALREALAAYDASKEEKE